MGKKLYVTKENHKQETRILEAIKPSLFKQIEFEHQTGAAIFDFKGYFSGKLILELDVKSREYHAEDFDEYFVEKDKVYRMRNNPTLSYYLALYFEKDKRIRVYCLNKVILKEKTISFSHKRDGSQVTKKVFVFPADFFEFEAYLM